jgi:hypothetical protein
MIHSAHVAICYVASQLHLAYVHVSMFAGPYLCLHYTSHPCSWMQPDRLNAAWLLKCAIHACAVPEEIVVRTTVPIHVEGVGEIWFKVNSSELQIQLKRFFTIVCIFMS